LNHNISDDTTQKSSLQWLIIRHLNMSRGKKAICAT